MPSLTPAQQRTLDQARNPQTDAPDQDLWDTAEWFIDHGFGVFLAEDKGPSMSWKGRRYTDLDELHNWAGRNTAVANWHLWVRADWPWCVVDCDNQAASDYWAERMGDAWASAAVVRTRGGEHRWFRLPAEFEGANWAQHPLKPGDPPFSFDIRGCTRGGVIIPPGKGRAWVKQLSAATVLTVEQALRLSKHDTTTGEAETPTQRATPAPAGKLNKAWAESALKAETDRLREMAGNPRSGRNAALNTASYSLGQLVGSGHFTAAEVETHLVSLAMECGFGRSTHKRDEVAREAYNRKTVQSGLQDGASKPRWAPPRTPAPVSVNVPVVPAEQGAALLQEVYDYLGRYIIYPNDHARVAHALWIFHVHTMDAWFSTPRIAFLAPERGCGKTRALEVTGALVPNPVHAVNVTPAYLFRKVSDPAGLPTVMYDEIDTVFGPKAKDNEDVRGMLNSGHRRGAMAGRCVVKGKEIMTEELPSYCAVAFAGIGNLPDTILSRSIAVRMRRRKNGQTVEPWRDRDCEPEAHALRDRIAGYMAGVKDDLAHARPVMPPEVTDRPADVWEPLIAIADQVAAGSGWDGQVAAALRSGVGAATAAATAHTPSDWPVLARVAAVAAVAAARDDSPSLGLLLLSDIRDIFQEVGGVAIRTALLITKLREVEESPWNSLRGEPIDPSRLAFFLGEYGIKSVQKKIKGVNQRSYIRADFEESWASYLPPPSRPEPATAATLATEDGKE